MHLFFSRSVQDKKKKRFLVNRKLSFFPLNALYALSSPPRDNRFILKSKIFDQQLLRVDLNREYI